MIAINSFQHSRILGWAVRGYGVSFAVSILSSIHIVYVGGTREAVLSLVWPSLLGNFVLLIVCFLAGASIRNRKNDFFDTFFVDMVAPEADGSKFSGSSILLFVLATVWLFPIGTLLSLYSLIYLYVIDPEYLPVPASQEQVTENAGQHALINPHQGG